jgi:enolase
MSTIVDVKARSVFDSRAVPTVEVDVILASGHVGRAMVPSGASTGRFEAHELRDGGERFGGKGVERAVANVRNLLAPELVGMDATRQAEVDRRLLEIDGTEDKGRVGANAILAVSLAVARAAAESLELPLYRYLGGIGGDTLPVPLLNILNGGRHADNNVDVQEFMVVPAGAASFREGLGWAVEVYHALRGVLRERGLSTAVGDEGGFAPDLPSDEEALVLLVRAVERAGLRPGQDVFLALDLAANELVRPDGYRLGGRVLAPEAYLDTLAAWVDAYPIVSLEDPAAEDDQALWQAVTQRLGGRVQLVGDDVFVTNPRRLAQGYEAGVANAVLVKPNQIGTLSETLETIALARQLGYRTVLSHRSGETEDTFLADLAVGANTGQIKTGAPARSERVAKYNQLLRIEEELGSARYGGALVVRRDR